MKTSPALKLLLVDFDGVMSNGRFYHTDNPDEHDVACTAVAHIFNANNSEILNKWMRGQYRYHDIHKLVQAETGIDAEKLDALLMDSVKRLPLNQRMIRFVQDLRKRGVIVSLFTNNMDIFDTVSRMHHRLDSYFDHIYSSSAHGQLKLENNSLINRALTDAKTDRLHTALVDDSLSSFKAAQQFGISTFLYANYENSQQVFEEWLRQEFSV